MADGFQDPIESSLPALQRVSSVASRIHTPESRRFAEAITSGRLVIVNQAICDRSGEALHAWLSQKVDQKLASSASTYEVQGWFDLDATKRVQVRNCGRENPVSSSGQVRLELP